MPRPAAGRGVVERVTVAVEDVGIAIFIEVDDRDPARTKVRIRRSPEKLGGELPLAVVDKRSDLLPLLADEAHDVGNPVAVDVDDEGVDWTG